MTQTFIPSKDAALEDSIARFQQKLLSLGFQIEETLWLNLVPNVWSVHIRDKECALCFTSDRRATEKATPTSTLDEYFKRLSTNYFFAGFWLSETITNGPFTYYPNEKWLPLTKEDDVPEGLLDARLCAFYDPGSELTDSMLIDLQPDNEEHGVCGLPFTHQSDDQTIYVPMSIIDNLYVSNDMSAGDTPNEARVQGLSEVFERHVRNRIIVKNISPPKILAEVMAHYPAAVEFVTTLETEGFPIFAYDGPLGGRYPVIYAVLLNPTNGTCFASFDAHPGFGVTLGHTVTELPQGCGLKDLDVFAPPTFDNEKVAGHTSLETHFIDSSGLISWGLFKQDADYPFVDWNFSGTTEEELATLMAIFNVENKEVHIADHEHLSIYTCRIIVPGMSSTYPAEDLWLANNTIGTHLRDTIPFLPGSEWDKEDYLNLTRQLDEEDSDDFTRVYELFGLAADADNGQYTLRIGEFKVMLALVGGDLGQVLVWTEWAMEFNVSVFSAEHANYYRCLQTSLLLSQEEDRQPLQYLNAFVRMYGAEVVKAASTMLSGEAPFYGLQPVGSSLHAFPAHQFLLKAYGKLQRAKAAHWSKQ